MAEEESTQSKRKKLLIGEWIDGSFLLKDFVHKQYKFLLLLVVFIIIYISNRYSVIMQLVQIDRLKQELIDVRYESLLYTSELMQESRQSHIKSLVKEKGLDLDETTIPPYKMTVHD